jgi:O-acetyl-ADP-ribose deacetylase
MKKNRVELLKGDITTIKVDAIVNAANNSLLGGGGVDGAVHKAAGPGLLEECRKLNGCPTGESRLTKGYDLSADFIIHTVGPIWRGGYTDETEQLSACYQSSLKIAKEKKFGSIAFPGISTGVYGFPRDLAAVIALNETRRFLSRNSYPGKVIFVAYDDEMFEIYGKLIKQWELI